MLSSPRKVRRGSRAFPDARWKRARAMLRGGILSFVLSLIPALRAANALTPSDAEQLFVHRIWPMLQDKCLPCHGKDEEKIKGGLDLRTKAAALEGGDSLTPAFSPGNPETSPLYLATTRLSD